MHRRRFITLLGCTSGYLFIAGAARSLVAQETRSAKIREVGFFYPGTVEASRLRIAAFLQGLQEKGYVEGQNVALVTRLQRCAQRNSRRSRYNSSIARLM
jgi:hypothetical protein